MPLELISSLGDLNTTMPMFLNPRDVAIAPNMTFMCVSDVDYHQVLVSHVSSMSTEFGALLAIRYVIQEPV